MITLEEAIARGPCALIGIKRLTGESLSVIWRHAQQYWVRDNGMTQRGIAETMLDMGWKFVLIPTAIHGHGTTETDYPSLREFRKALRAYNSHDDLNLLICVDCGESGHAISFKNGRLHNTLGLYTKPVSYALHFVRLDEQRAQA